MTKISVKPPSGFRDFTLTESMRRNRIELIIATQYASFGFHRIQLPACENLETLLGKGGGRENEKLIFQILKRGDALKRALQDKDSISLSDLGLRFDLTLPLARYYSKSKNELPKPFKVFQIAPVWRAERAQKGRYREFIQCDVDIIDCKGIGAEIDILQAIGATLASFSIPGIHFEINDRRLLTSLGLKIGADETTWAKALVTLDKWDKIGEAEIFLELAEYLNAKQIESMKKFLFLDESNWLETWSELNPSAASSLKQILNTVSPLLANFGLTIAFSPTLVRGQDYYSGTIFESKHPDVSGSLAGGGRYDNLLSLFSNQAVPCFGGSIGFERLFMILESSNYFSSVSSQKRFLVTVFAENLRTNANEIAAVIRTPKQITDVYPDSTKLKNQLKFASNHQYDFVVIQGPDEADNSVVKIKNMKNSEEKTISLTNLESEAKKLCQN